MKRYDRPVSVYYATTTTNGRGVKTATYTLRYSMSADVQALGKSPARRAEFGLDSTESNARAMYYDSEYLIQSGDYVKIGSEVWQVRNVQDWTGHSEAILVPVQVTIP